MNFHQTTEEIIKNATAEQRILWNHVFLQFGEKIGITQLYFSGVFVGSEFLIYSANKMYLGFLCNVGTSGIIVTYNSYLLFYNELNSLSFMSGKNAFIWNGTSASQQYSAATFSLQNIVFSRVNVVGYTGFNFTGYRLSI